MEQLYKNIHQDIIDRCKEYNREAQFQLYKLYYKAMYNVSLRIVKVPELAEDIMQESFLKAFEKIESYRGEVSFGLWLKRIVINKSLDEIKKHKQQLFEINEQIIPEEVAEEQAEEAFSYSIEDVKKVISELPDGYRVVLNLYLIEGYDHEEIAQILGIGNSSSRSQYIRAKRKLKELLIVHKRKTISLN
ncbi:RNA polymerase sigma factor [Puteibacter caeruleilacunae]|nr:RNA polymerase sigma factor [Puteibacter caeruleilacunae]